MGLASNYTLLSGTLNTLLNQLFNGITASVGNLNAVESKEKKLAMFNIINLANFWLFGWAAIGIFVVSTDIVELMFGSAYVLPNSIPFVIALNFYMVGMQGAVWTYKNTMGLFRQGRYLLIVTAAINLGCSIWLGKIWGLFGILFATGISRAVTNTWYDPYAVFKYGLKEKTSIYFKKYMQYAVILTITGAACYLICARIHLSVLANVVTKFIMCCIVPNLIFFLCLRKKEEFQYFINLLRRVMRKVFVK